MLHSPEAQAESILDASKAVKAQLPPDGLHLLVNCSGALPCSVASASLVRPPSPPHTLLQAEKSRPHPSATQLWRTSTAPTRCTSGHRCGAPAPLRPLHAAGLTCNAAPPAQWLLTRELLPHLTAAKGAVVNVACQPPVHTYPPCFPYGVSKAALSHASNVGCRELASASVRLNMISPGASAGPAGSSVAPTTVAVDQPQEVAEAVLFLGNGVAAGFITGTELEVAGGATLQSADAAAAAAAAPS